MDFERNIPTYLLEKSNVVKMILFTAVFALVFINVFSPFNSRQWIPEASDFKYFVLSCVLVLSGMAVVALSRVIMYKIYSGGRKGLSLMAYLSWVACEIFFMSVVFSLFEIFFFNDERDVMLIMKISFKNTSWVLLLPYCLTWLYFSWCDKNQKLKTIVDDAGGTDGDAAGKVLKTMINFTDSKGEVKLCVRLADLLYIKGADNYITIFHRSGSQIESVMVRNTMKYAESSLKDKGIVRCHRSYMVNKRYIKMFSKVKDGFEVKLETEPSVQIPVSKSYVNDVFELLDS